MDIITRQLPISTTIFRRLFEFDSVTRHFKERRSVLLLAVWRKKRKENKSSLSTGYRAWSQKQWSKQLRVLRYRSTGKGLRWYRSWYLQRDLRHWPGQLRNGQRLLHRGRRRDRYADAQLHRVQPQRERITHSVPGRRLPVRYQTLLYHESSGRYWSLCGRRNQQVCDSDRKSMWAIWFWRSHKGTANPFGAIHGQTGNQCSKCNKCRKSRYGHRRTSSDGKSQ